jgi:hypothetical protein
MHVPLEVPDGLVPNNRPPGSAWSVSRLVYVPFVPALSAPGDVGFTRAHAGGASSVPMVTAPSPSASLFPSSR